MGAREDDFFAAGADFHRRGRLLDEQMGLLRRLWAGDPYGDGAGPIGPAPATPGGPEVLFGGFAPAALDRVGRHGDGFLGAGLPPKVMDRLFREAERSWERHARAGRPRLVAQANVALGPDAVISAARANIRDYYAFSGFADRFAEGLLTTSEQIRDTVAGYGGIGADEVMLYCWASDPGQVERLADVVS